LTSGGLTVDTTTLDADAENDALILLESAQTGNEAAARRLVLDGTLQRWTEAGLVGGVASSNSRVAEVLATEFGMIGAWVTSAYGLFVTGLPECP
jgi:hypothetical protein